MSGISNAKTHPGRASTYVTLAGLADDLDVNPPARAIYCNSAGNISLWAPEDDLTGASSLFTVAAAGQYIMCECARIDYSATTVTSWVFLY